MKKRDRLTVIHDILYCVRENRNSVRFTTLLRSSRLSTATFSEYYSELSAKGFLLEVTDKRGGRFVTLMEKGFLYLEKNNLIRGLIDEFEL